MNKTIKVTRDNYEWFVTLLGQEKAIQFLQTAHNRLEMAGATSIPFKADDNDTDFVEIQVEAENVEASEPELDASLDTENQRQEAVDLVQPEGDSKEVTAEVAAPQAEEHVPFQLFSDLQSKMEGVIEKVEALEKSSQNADITLATLIAMAQLNTVVGAPEAAVRANSALVKSAAVEVIDESANVSFGIVGDAVNSLFRK